MTSQYIVRRKRKGDKLDLSLHCPEECCVAQKIKPGGLVAKKNGLLTEQAPELLHRRLQTGEDIRAANGKTTQQNGESVMKQEMAKAEILHMEVRRGETIASMAGVLVHTQRCDVDSQVPSVDELKEIGAPSLPAMSTILLASQSKANCI